MSIHITSDSAQYLEPIRTQPSYSFTDLQEIWQLQKALLEEFKSTEIPFIALDFENNGVLTASDFPDRFVMKGFPNNPSLYLLFFAFLDTDCDGYINKEDWIEGFKNIGTYLLETRALARDHLKNVKAESQSLPILPSQYASPSRKTIHTDPGYAPKTWESAKSFGTLRDEASYNPHAIPKKGTPLYIQEYPAAPVQSQISPKASQEQIKATLDKIASQNKVASGAGSVGSVHEGRLVEKDFATRSGAEETVKNKHRIESISQNSMTSLRNGAVDPMEIKANFGSRNPSQIRVEDVSYYSANQTQIHDSQFPDPVELKMEGPGMKQYEAKLDQILLRSQSSFKGESVVNRSGVPTKPNPSLASIEASLIAKKEEGASGNSSERSHKNSLEKLKGNNEILRDMETKHGHFPQISVIQPTGSSEAAPKSGEIYQSIKEASEDAMEAVLGVLDSERQRQKLNNFIENRRGEHSQITVPENSNGRGGYAPSVTSIAAADEESIMQNDPNAKKGVKSMGALENNLAAKVAKSSRVKSSHELYVHRGSEDSGRSGRVSSNNQVNNSVAGSNMGLKTTSLSKKEPSPNGSRISLISKSAASQLLGFNSRPDEQLPYQLSDERRGNNRSIVIHNAEMSPTELGTPSWKEPAARNFTETTEQEEDLFLMVERMLEGHGGLEDALRMLQKEDLSRFPHIQMLVRGLEKQAESERNMYYDDEERGRGFMQPVRRRSQTRSLIEVRVRGDLSMEIQEDLQRKRRAFTPDTSLVHSTGRFRKDSQSLRGSRNILDSLKELERLKPQEAQGLEGAMEVLEKSREEMRRKSIASERSRSRSERKSFLEKDGAKERPVVEIPEPRKFGEAKKMCQEILETFKEEKTEKNERKKKEKQKKDDGDGDGLWNSLGYRIRSDDVVVTRKERPQKGFLWGDRRGYEEEEDDRNSRLKKVIDQLSEETSAMEARINYHRIQPVQPHRKELYVETGADRNRDRDVDSGLWGMFRGKGTEDRQVRTPIKTFLRGSIMTSDMGERERDSTLNLSQEQQHVQGQLEKTLSSPRLLGKYSRIVADLGSLSLKADKQETQRQRSPLSAVKSAKERAVNVSIEEEFTGRGKTYLLSQMTRNNVVNKDFIQANKSLRNAGW